MAADDLPTSRDQTDELQAFVERVELRVQQYLEPRADRLEQNDHLRHVADRTRWLYYSELNREHPGLSANISRHEDTLIEACVYSHDIAKWIPRPDLQRLAPDPAGDFSQHFSALRLTGFQEDLFRLGLRRRYDLPQDGYAPEYDSAHHLYSAFVLSADASLEFARLDPGDQERLIRMIIGHQFGSYFKETLLYLSLQDADVTTGMLTEASRPDRVTDDRLASAFHDADISDLLFVGSLEQRPNREPLFHVGGLVKILMINFTNLVFGAPHAPETLEACLTSCQRTVTNVCKEFITATAALHGAQWRKQARRFLAIFREPAISERLQATLDDAHQSPAERLTSVRTILRQQARNFLTGSEEED